MGHVVSGLTFDPKWGRVMTPDMLIISAPPIIAISIIGIITFVLTRGPGLWGILSVPT
jgi:hypothetical protein